MAVPRNRIVVFALLALGGALIDLVTKRVIFDWLGMPGGQSWWLVDKTIGLGFTTSLNEGALFGVGQGQVAFFTLLSLVAAVWILYFLFVQRAAEDWQFTIAFGAVTAGILGNMYDRVGLPALRWNFPNGLNQAGDPVFAVRDWIHFKVLEHTWPIFNIADSLLVCGVGLLMWHSLRSAPSNSPHEKQVDEKRVGEKTASAKLSAEKRVSAGARG